MKLFVDKSCNMSIKRPSFDDFLTKSPTLGGGLTLFTLKAYIDGCEVHKEVINLSDRQSVRVTHGNDEVFKRAFQQHEHALYDSLIDDDKCRVIPLPQYTGSSEMIRKCLKTMIGGFVLKYRSHSLQVYRLCQIRLFHSDNHSFVQSSKIDRSIQNKIVYKDIFSYRTLFALIKKNFDSRCDEEIPCPVTIVEVGSDKIRFVLKPINWKLFVDHVNNYLRRENEKASLPSTSKKVDTSYFAM